MKKLLLVLLVVALASFLFVGCLPTTPAEGEGEGEGEGEVEVAMTIEKEYTDAGGVTFVACGKDVIVTLPTAVETDYIVYVAVKVWDETEEEYAYYCMEAGTPDVTRTVWTVEDYTELCCAFEKENGEICIYDECEPICLVALVKHPCCPGEEVALRVVTLDCTEPYADLSVTFKDCYDPCVDTPECPPFPVPGAYFEFSSRVVVDPCDPPVDCCGDDCSDFASWELIIDPDPCVPACDTVSGSACPVEGVVECGCLPYAAGGDEPTLTYDVTYTLLDNVGNKFKDTWIITVGTDSVVSIDVPLGTSGPVTMDEPVYIYTGNCD